MDELQGDVHPHIYVSTACLHGKHDLCQNMLGRYGRKRPGKCEFCDSRCICPCHSPADSQELFG